MKPSHEIDVKTSEPAEIADPTSGLVHIDIDSPDDGDPLLSFHTETSLRAPRAIPSRPDLHDRIRSRRVPCLVAVGVVALLAIGAAAFAYVQNGRRVPLIGATEAPSTGTAEIDAHPQAFVTIDGEMRGPTPLTLMLPAGSHAMELRVGEITKHFSLMVEAGVTIREIVELAAEASATEGRLEVASEPPGAAVSIDGSAKGTAPLTVGSLTAGEHDVTVSTPASTVRKKVTIAAGTTSSMVVAIPAADSSAGWIAIKAPAELTLVEKGQVVGTTRAGRVMLPTGVHRLELVNTALAFRTTLSVRIEAGKTATANIPLPNGSLSINAQPWARVWVDGNEVGTTPIGNLTVPVGMHDIVLRHPQYGERQQTVAVPVGSPARMGVDFNR